MKNTSIYIFIPCAWWMESYPRHLDTLQLSEQQSWPPQLPHLAWWRCVSAQSCLLYKTKQLPSEKSHWHVFTYQWVNREGLQRQLRFVKLQHCVRAKIKISNCNPLCLRKFKIIEWWKRHIWIIITLTLTLFLLYSTLFTTSWNK